MPSQRATRPTMAQVAAAAGVSVMTVSYAYSQPGRLSPTAAAQVAEAAQRLGYTGPHPGARALRRGRAGALGVVIGEHLTYAFDDPSATAFLSGVAQVCADAGVALTLVPVTGTADDLARIAAAAVDAFVIWTLDGADPVLAAVAATGRPAAAHGATTTPGLVPVGIDDRAAAAAIGALAFTGATHPVVLSFPLSAQRRPGLEAGLDPGRASFPVTRDRLAGLRDAWTSSGRAWSQVRVAICPANTATDAAAAIDQVLADGGPLDAIAAMSDELALAAMTTLNAAGHRVPDHVAITGFDDTPSAATAGLSTIDQDLRAQGAQCATLALTPQPGSPGPAPAEWHLVQRTSTRPRT